MVGLLKRGVLSSLIHLKLMVNEIEFLSFYLGTLFGFKEYKLQGVSGFVGILPPPLTLDRMVQS